MALIDSTFWFVQRNFIQMLLVVTIVVLAMIPLGLIEYAQPVEGAYFALLAILAALRSNTDIGVRVGFGGAALLVIAMIVALYA